MMIYKILVSYINSDEQALVSSYVVLDMLIMYYLKMHTMVYGS